jgi:hypothetical protein
MYDEKDVKQMLDYIYDEITIDIFKSTVKDFKDKFDYNIYTTIDFIEKNSTTFSEDKWFELYENNKNNTAVLISLISQKNVPITITEAIVNDTDIIKKPKSTIHIDNFNDAMAENRIISVGLNHKLSEPTLTSILNSAKKTSFSLEFTDIHPDNLKFFCHKLIESDLLEFNSKEDLDCYRLAPIYDCFSCIKDKKFLNELLELDRLQDVLHEQIRIKIINNEFLTPDDPTDAELIDGFFDLGCPIERVNVYTPHISEQYSYAAYESFLSCFNKEGKLNLSKTHDFLSITRNLTDLVEVSALSPDIEYDIAKRIATEPDINFGELTNAIFRNTKNEDILKEIEAFDEAEQFDIILSNPFVSKEMLNRYRDKYCDSIRAQAYSFNTDNFYIPIGAENIFADFMKKTSFRDIDYELFLNLKSFKCTYKKLSASPYTPKDVLEILTDFSRDPKNKLSSNIALFATINSMLQDTDNKNIHEIMHNLYYYVSNTTTATMDIEAIINDEDDLFYIGGYLKKILNSFNEKEFVDFVSFLNDYKNDTKTTDKEKEELTSLISSLNIAKTKIENKIKLQNGNYDNVDKLDINTRLNEILTFEHYNDKLPDTYIAISKNIDEFFTLTDKLAIIENHDKLEIDNNLFCK